MKSILFCLTLALASTAQAGLVLSGPDTNNKAYGFGTAPPVLTLQAGPLEQGCVAPTTSSPFWTNLGCGVTGVGLVNGSDKNSAPMLSDRGVLTGWNQLGLLLNINEPGGDQISLTLQSLVLKLYNGTTFKGSFSLGDALTLTDLSNGQGGAGFLFIIDPSQYGQLAFDSSYRVGLEAVIGCAAGGTCETGDGAESFTITTLAGEGPQEVPEPATAALLGGGLIALAWTLRRRKAS